MDASAPSRPDKDPRVALREKLAAEFAAEVKRLQNAFPQLQSTFSFREGSRGFQFVVTKKNRRQRRDT